jgi:hypothetical protein
MTVRKALEVPEDIDMQILKRGLGGTYTTKNGDLYSRRQ